MKKTVPFILAALILTVQTALALTAREIVEKSDNLPRPKTAVSEVTMTIHTGGSVIEKAFTLEAMETAKNDSKALISFTRPTRIKLLTHTHPDTEDDQWLMMSSGKVKRITTSAKSKSFVNSHFCYEDLSSRKIDEYSYTLLPDQTVLDTDCYAIESTKKSGKKVYDKIILSVRKTDFFVVQVDFFQKGKHAKRLENHDIRTVDGILTPFDIRMIEAEGAEWTGLAVASVSYNKEIASATFNKEALR